MTIFDWWVDKLYKYCNVEEDFTPVKINEVGNQVEPNC